MEEQVAYGTTEFQFTIKRSERKTLAIEVYPDQSIQVVAPIKASVSDIKDKLLKRGSWIIKQQLYFEQFLPRTPEREYVSGESHKYLGRRYQLKLRRSQEMKVKLKGAELLVFLPDVDNKEEVKRLLANWYYHHARSVFQKCVTESVKRFREFNLSEPPLKIRRMNARWGSCTPKGDILLNPEIIKAPSKCIEYVVIHEMCHLIHPNHGRAFYDLQKKMMPDWDKWKLRLEQMLM